MNTKKELYYLVLKDYSDSSIFLLENKAPYRFCERNKDNIVDKKFIWKSKDVLAKLLYDFRTETRKGINIIACVNDKPMTIFSQKMFLEERKDLNNEERYKLWRKSIYKKCNYKCIACGSNKNIQAHHTVGFRLAPNLRYHKSNGVCLCQNCHNEFHSIYGKIANTREELDEFIKSKNPDLLF